MPTPIVLLLTIAASALPGADLSGKWVGTIELEKTRPLSLFLHQKGQSIEGGVAIDAESMRFPVQNGELRENAVTFTMICGAGLSASVSKRAGANWLAMRTIVAMLRK